MSFAAMTACVLVAGCGSYTERTVVEKPVPVPAQRTTVYTDSIPSPTPTTVYTTTTPTTVYTTR